MTFSIWGWQIVQDLTTTVLYIITPPFFWGPLPHLERVLSALNHPESTKNTKEIQKVDLNIHTFLPQQTHQGTWYPKHITMVVGWFQTFTWENAWNSPFPPVKKLAGSRGSRNPNGGRTYNDGTQQLLGFPTKKMISTWGVKCGKKPFKETPKWCSQATSSLAGLSLLQLSPVSSFPPWCCLASAGGTDEQ